MSILELSEKTPSVHSSAFVADSAQVIGDVSIGPDSGIWFGCVLRGDVDKIVVGAKSNIQDLSVLHADTGEPTIIGDSVTVGHRAIIHACTVEDFVLVGMGAILLNNVTVGTESMIAAGSVVSPGTKVPPRTLMMGVPAKARRELKDAEVEHIRRSAASYVKYREMYR